MFIQELSDVKYRNDFSEITVAAILAHVMKSWRYYRRMASNLIVAHIFGFEWHRSTDVTSYCATAIQI